MHSHLVLALTLCFLSLCCNARLVAEEKPKAKVPQRFKVEFQTSQGNFTVEVHRELAPKGVDRFHQLVKEGFYNNCRFFRVVPGFVAQFGINGTPEVQKNWVNATIQDDPVKASNVRGTITFATAGPNSRTTQLFINTKDNSRLDQLGFAPFATITEGMKVVDNLYSDYGESPNQGRIQDKGNGYLKQSFPKLDYIKKVVFLKEKKKLPTKDTKAKKEIPRKEPAKVEVKPE